MMKNIFEKKKEATSGTKSPFPLEKLSNKTCIAVDKVYEQKKGIIGINRDAWLHAIYLLDNLLSGRMMVGMSEEFYQLMLIPEFIHACENSLLLLS
jgi:hypothetical protein